MKRILILALPLLLTGCFSGLTTPDSALRGFQAILGQQQQVPLEQRLDKAVEEAKAIHEAAEELRKLYGPQAD